jgi:hypothetical protein
VGDSLPLRETVRTTMMARTKAIPMIAYIGIAALLAAATSPTAAQEVQVQSVVAIDGKVACSQMKTGATRPCEEFTPPLKVAVGETFSADGKTRQIGIIRAAQVKGEWICVAAETLEDIPVDKSRDRTWLAILKCKPALPGRAPLLPPE